MTFRAFGYAFLWHVALALGVLCLVLLGAEWLFPAFVLPYVPLLPLCAFATMLLLIVADDQGSRWSGLVGVGGATVVASASVFILYEGRMRPLVLAVTLLFLGIGFCGWRFTRTHADPVT